MTLSTIPAMAQTSTGGITGRVEDSQHAMVADATVTITNVDTNASVVVRTNGSGIYEATALPPGTYTVDITKKGFEDERITSVSINIAATATVNAAMKIGAATATVTVTAEAQMVNADAPTVGIAVPETLSDQLPYDERSALSVVMLAPGVQGDPQYDMGVQSENPGIYTQPVTPGASFQIDGSRPGQAMQLVDGVDLSMVGYARVAVTFSGDDLKQISVQSGAISAKYGRSGGGVINQASKGGGTQYHGKVAFRHEDPFFEATTYGQGNLTYTTPTGTLLKPITQNIHQNMFTGVLSGPVPIPYFNINRKTFFLVSYEPLRGGQKVWSRARVPTPAELSGDFSNAYTLLNTTILSTQGYAAAIAAPRVGGLDYQFALNSAGFPIGLHYSSSTQYVPIPNYNLSAQLAQNAFAKFFLSQFPQPDANGNGTPYVNFIYPDAHYAGDGNNAYATRGVQNSDNRYNVRIDENIGSSDHAFVRFTKVPVTGIRYSFMGPNSVIDNQPTSTVDSINTVVDYTHVFRSSMVNDVRASYTRMNYQVSPAPVTTTTDFAAKYGLTPSEMGVGMPSLSIDTGSYGSSTGGNDGGLSVNEVFSYGDDLSLVIGRHSLSFGGEWRAMQLDRLPNAGIFGGSYSFSAGNTNNGSAGGNATASFILGSINGLTLSPLQEFYYRYKYFGAYVMDEWKVLPNLTLNLGLRYHLEFPRTEKNGLQGSFLPNVNGTLNGVSATGAFAFSGTSGLPTTLWPVNYKCWEPRVGFSWALKPNLVIAGSGNLMHSPMTGVTNSNIPALTPSSLSIGGATGGTNSAAWVNYITNPVSLPSTGIPGVLTPPNPFFSYGTGYLPWVSQSNAVPYSENWSFSVQYQPAKNTMVQVAYVGANSHHQFLPLEETNILPLSTLISQVQSNYNFSSATIPATYFPTVKVNANANSLPFPQFYNNTIQTAFVREGSSSYNGLYLSGTQRMSQGLTVLGSFSWAKTMDDNSGSTIDGIGDAGIFGLAYQQSPYTRVGERSLADYDVPIRGALGYSWDLPLGRGKWINVSNHLLDKVVGGLHVSGMLNSQTGFPYWVTLGSVGYFTSNTVTTGTSGTTVKYGGNGNAITNGNGLFLLRPNLMPGVPLRNPNWRQDPYNLTGSGGFINPAAFAVPGSAGTSANNYVNTPAFGNSPRVVAGSARNPITFYLNMSGSKDINLHEKLKLTLRADAINILNHTNFFVNPNSNHNFTSSLNSTTGAYVQNTSFGTLSAANNTPGRTFAVGASLTF